MMAERDRGRAALPPLGGVVQRGPAGAGRRPNRRRHLLLKGSGVKRKRNRSINGVFSYPNFRQTREGGGSPHTPSLLLHVHLGEWRLRGGRQQETLLISLLLSAPVSAARCAGDPFSDISSFCTCTVVTFILG